MSFASFFAGLTGLQTNSSRLSVIGNNLSNINTIGFKSSRATFMDIFSSAGGVSFSASGNPMQVGRGAQFASIDQLFSQGSLQSTSLLTDISIQGNGFFVLADQEGAQSFTRAGNFIFDEAGNLKSSNGRFVQGFTGRDSQNNILTSGSVGNINIPQGLTTPPLSTGEFRLDANLDAGAVPDDPATAGIMEGVPFTTTITVYDSLGATHNVTLEFIPTDTDVPLDGSLNEWRWEATVPGEDVVGGVAGTPYTIGRWDLGGGALVFDPDGQLIQPAANEVFNIPAAGPGAWANGSDAQDITWELYDSTGTGTLTGWDGQSSVSSVTQDGFSLGILRTLIIDAEGLISGIFTNGVTEQLARISIANFNSPPGLLRDGQNSFLATNSSGQPTIGAANSGGRGSTTSSTLEMSNVDITEEFTNMIMTQRGYQANSRIITTTDEIVQEALTLKR